MSDRPLVPDDAKPLSLVEVAKLFGKNRSSVLRLVKSGALPGGKVGRSYYVSVAAVRAAIGGKA